VDSPRGREEQAVLAPEASSAVVEPEVIRRATPGQDQAADAGVLPCSSAFVVRPRYLMDNWQLQHRRSLAFDEQRHQDIASPSGNSIAS